MPEPPSPESGDALTLAHYAERAYLEYALSVVKGRALPDVCDGQKPVQRRILYAMQRMGLTTNRSNAGPTGARPVKSARVVGDVLGRFHPHGDQAAYDALVRMAQDFSQRYPLIDGQGNFGSRDGDGAAAMRYTEARLAPIARLLLDEIDAGTVEFMPNYDGSTEEPRQLPARLPFVLLNGASGIAVGLATEIPSHNLREVAAAAVALIRDEQLSDDQLAELLPGPDFPGGAQIISTPAEIREAYRGGRGSLKVRARWSELMARWDGSTSVGTAGTAAGRRAGCCAIATAAGAQPSRSCQRSLTCSPTSRRRRSSSNRATAVSTSRSTSTRSSSRCAAVTSSGSSVWTSERTATSRRREVRAPIPRPRTSLTAVH